jgi:hypothetical protein
MIVIEDKDFKMVQSSKTGPFFNLYLPYTVNEGKDNERTEMRLSGYGHSFSYCVDLLVKIRLARKNPTYTMSSYMNEYIKEIDEVEKLIQHVETVKEENND